MLIFTFSEGTSVHNFLFTSNSEVAVPELFLVVCSADMAKYVSLLSSLYFRRVSLMVRKAISTNLLLWGNLRLEALCMKFHDLEKNLKLSLNTT